MPRMPRKSASHASHASLPCCLAASHFGRPIGCTAYASTVVILLGQSGVSRRPITVSCVNDLLASISNVIKTLQNIFCILVPPATRRGQDSMGFRTGHAGLTRAKTILGNRTQPHPEVHKTALYDDTSLNPCKQHRNIRDPPCLLYSTHNITDTKDVSRNRYTNSVKYYWLAHALPCPQIVLQTITVLWLFHNVYGLAGDW